MGAVDSSHPAKTVRLLWKKLMRIQKKERQKKQDKGTCALPCFRKTN